MHGYFFENERCNEKNIAWLWISECKFLKNIKLSS